MTYQITLWITETTQRRMTGSWLGKDVEGSGSGLVFARSDWKNHESLNQNSQSAVRDMNPWRPKYKFY
jgi:hypothetical protein